MEALLSPAAKGLERGRVLRMVERAGCPACGGARIVERFRQPFAEGDTWAFLQRYYEGRITQAMLGEGDYVIAACEGCGLHFQREVLDDAGLEFLYETAISAAASLAKREEAGPAYFAGLVHDAARVSRLVPAERARAVRVLDFGMGWGHWAAAAKALGCTVQGAEISEQRIAFAAGLGVPTVDPAELSPGSLDYIHADQVFEHLAEPAAVLAGLVRLLRPAGVIRIAVPDGGAVAAKLKAGWRAAKDELHPLEHLNAYTPAALDRMASAAGLRREPDLWTARLKRLARRGRPAPGGYYRKVA
jgi:SAM-dependent methyltransferase